MNAPRPEFAFVGRPAIDLTWTLRYRAVWPTELLTTPDDLCRWLVAAGLPAPARTTARHLAAAHSLREAVHRLIGQTIDGDPLAPTDIAIVNRCAAHPTPHPVLRADGTRHVYAPRGEVVTSSLASIARDAVDLLTIDASRLRRCAGPLCSLVFHDASRPGTRRWCSAAGCGNKVNTKAYRDRHRSS